MKRNHITGFYIETLVLIVVFIGALLVLTRIFGLGRNMSQSARLLTGAVSLSENAAEAVAASRSIEEAAELLDENGNAAVARPGLIRANYNDRMFPDPEGEILLQVTWEPQEKDAGTLVSSRIEVLEQGAEEPLYVLETAVFLEPPEK
ncbi:MAG: hypothetical protein IJ106_13325 [Parasporobacterium sp.]|nr:hypothetical protein [Parasporobacterium sp.]